MIGFIALQLEMHESLAGLVAALERAVQEQVEVNLNFAPTGHCRAWRCFIAYHAATLTKSSR